jgi:hypothetical protein
MRKVGVAAWRCVGAVALQSVAAPRHLSPRVAYAQELEPRAYSAAPIGTNFLLAGYTRTSGSVSLDPSLPITNVEATINTVSLGYSRTFALFGQTASAAILLPFFRADLSGDVGGQGRKISRSGLGDLRMRFAQSLFGSPALSPEAFAQRKPSTSLGASLTVLAPTGDYNPAHLINIGSNRWAFKPEIGLSQPFGRWFTEASFGAWFFTDNENFFGGNVRSERPITTLQLHFGYNFGPNLWLAVDGTHYRGGETGINGVENSDRQSVSRYGLTLSLPIADGISTKLSWASWLTSCNGGNYDTIGVALQSRWFDR